MTTFDTKSALLTLGATDSTLSADEKASLERDGFLALPGILSPVQLEAIRARLDELLAAEKENAGKEFEQEAGTTRFANLLDKGDAFRICFTHPRVLAAIAHVLSWDIKLSSLNSRAALPGQGLQGLHPDWGKAVAPGEYKVCNSIWLIDDFTPENGATRIVPGTHRSGKMPAEVMANPSDPHPEQKLIIAPAGTVVVFNSHTWHGGTLNRTASPRRSLHSYWTRRGEKQQQQQSALLSDATKASFPAPLKFLLELPA